VSDSECLAASSAQSNVPAIGLAMPLVSNVVDALCVASSAGPA
jgi:hypothetical protein